MDSRERILSVLDSEIERESERSVSETYYSFRQTPIDASSHSMAIETSAGFRVVVVVEEGLRGLPEEIALRLGDPVIGEIWRRRSLRVR